MRLLRHWSALLWLPLLAALLAMGLSLFMPVAYVAQTQILLRASPPAWGQNQERLERLESREGTPARSPAFYGALLRSARLNDRIIGHFNLQQAHGDASRAATRARLEDDVEIGSHKGLLIIRARAHYPWLAADIARQYVIELRRLLDEMRQEEASARADRLKAFANEIALRLQRAQQTLQASGIDQATLHLDRQYATAHHQSLQRALRAAELGLTRVSFGHGPQSIPVQQQQAQVEALRQLLRQAESRAESAPARQSSQGHGYADAYREMRRLDALLRTLRLQEATARGDMGYAAESLLTVDRPEIPLRRSQPNSLLMMLGAWLLTVVGLLCSHCYRLTQTKTRSIPP